jgi:hypothetical protein
VVWSQYRETHGASVAINTAMRSATTPYTTASVWRRRPASDIVPAAEQTGDLAVDGRRQAEIEHGQQGLGRREQADQAVGLDAEVLQVQRNDRQADHRGPR